VRFVSSAQFILSFFQLLLHPWVQTAQPIRSHETDGRFGSQQVKVRKDFVFKELPKLAVVQSAQTSRQKSGKQQRCRKPLSPIAGAQSPTLLVDKFLNLSLNRSMSGSSHLLVIQSGWKNWLPNAAVLPKIFAQNQTIS
jgi:hypothetical protein